MENKANIEKKTKRLCELVKSFSGKRDIYLKRSLRARKPEKGDLYFEKNKMYSSCETRARDLAYEIRKGLTEKRIRDWADKTWIDCEYAARLQRKKENKAQFQARHKYSLWFIQNSLGADYGVFCCDKCGCTFYHSPAEITLAGKVEYKCCCGNCTNRIIKADWGEEAYF